MLLDILILISVLVAMMFMRSLTGIFPSLAACLIRTKECFNLEASAKLSRSRNRIALVMILPFCLTVVEYDLFDPEIMKDFSENLTVITILAVFIIWYMLRLTMSRLFRSQKIGNKIYSAAEGASYTFFIILTLVLLSVAGVTSVLNMDEAPVRNAMLWISAVTYGLFLIRKTEIFMSSCSIFTAFLYLCALEIIPTGILVVSAIIF